MLCMLGRLAAVEDRGADTAVRVIGEVVGGARFE